MCVLNHKYGYIFCHEPHTAGRSIEAALMQHEDSHNFNGKTHILPAEMIDLGWVTEYQLDTYTKFRVIRNPYDWLVTCWLTHTTERTREFTPFYGWAVLLGPNFISRGTLFWRYKEAATRGLDYENLLGDLDSFLVWECYAPPVKLEHTGVTPNKPDWRDILTITQAKHLEELYPDIQFYDYSIFK